MQLCVTLDTTLALTYQTRTNTRHPTPTEERAAVVGCTSRVRHSRTRPVCG